MIGEGAHDYGESFLRKYSLEGELSWSIAGTHRGAFSLAADASRGTVSLVGFGGREHVVVQQYDVDGRLLAEHALEVTVGDPAVEAKFGESESAFGIASGPLGVFVNGEWGPHTYGGTLDSWPGWEAVVIQAS